MKTPFEAYRQSNHERKAMRCHVCQARVKRDSRASYGFSCPKCGRHYIPLEIIAEVEAEIAKLKEQPNGDMAGVPQANAADDPAPDGGPASQEGGGA